MLQIPWLQVGTPFMLTSTVSANVADDMAEFEADNPGRWTEERFRSSSSGFFHRCTPALTLATPVLVHVHLRQCTSCSAMNAERGTLLCTRRTWDGLMQKDRVDEKHVNAVPSQDLYRGQCLCRVTMDAAVPSLAAADVGPDVLEDFEARGGGGRHVQAQPPRRAAPSHVSLLSRAIPRSVFADSPVASLCHRVFSPSKCLHEVKGDVGDAMQVPKHLQAFTIVVVMAHWELHVHMCSRLNKKAEISTLERMTQDATPRGAQPPELEGIVEEQAQKPADEDAAENGEGSEPADGEPETAWYKDPLVSGSCCRLHTGRCRTLLCWVLTLRVMFTAPGVLLEHSELLKLPED
jgi:hypothetical protein